MSRSQTTSDFLPNHPPSALVKRFAGEAVRLADGAPIVDVACGTARNAIFLAQLGASVLGIDIDLEQTSPLLQRCIELQPRSVIDRMVFSRIDLDNEPWPFLPGSIGGIINIHFYRRDLLAAFSESLRPGGMLLLQTVDARGGNYNELPQTGVVKSSLGACFHFLHYRERPAGPQGFDAVAVALVALKL